MSTRYVPFAYDFNRNLNFIYRENVKLAKINYSNKRTLTGRITSKDNYNPQNLSKSNEERTKIISKFRNGRIYQFDYTSFEARIALYLSEDEEFIQRFYDKDLHSETARIIFESQDFTPEQRDIAKLVNHSILYGASEATILKKLEGQEYPIEKMLRVKEFLSPLFAKSKELMLQAENDGYIINKWGSIIKPEKSYAGFNNYIQSTASEIVIDKVCEIKALLKGYQSDFLFQVHDSLVFDIHPEEVFLVEKIAKTLSFHRGMMFSIDYKSGINYKDLSSEGVYF
jgi:DNA polymerase-1